MAFNRSGFTEEEKISIALKNTDGNELAWGKSMMKQDNGWEEAKIKFKSRYWN